jgi:sulfide:quinone oxidoreductase
MAGSERLTWDFLVIALGADLDLGVVPGLAEAAESFYTVEGAERLRRKLEAFPGGDVVVLIPKIPFKCPPAPYEAAMLLEEAFRRRGAAARLAIHTVEPAPMGTAGPEMGAFIKAELARRDIAYFPQRVTGRVDASEGRIVFQDGGEARYDLLIAIPPHVAPQVVREAGLTGPAGWIPVDPRTLEVAGHPNVHAVGDVAAVPLPGRFKPEMPLSLPKAGVFAHAQGRVAAHRIAARILGTAAEETFDGKGYCFLETGGGRAVKAEGSFFDLPHPAMEKREPDPTQLREKHAWVDGLLRTPA